MSRALEYALVTLIVVLVATMGVLPLTRAVLDRMDASANLSAETNHG